MRFTLPVLLAVAVAGCAGREAADANPSVTVDDGLSLAHAQLEGIAPPHLVERGSYSDVRFCEMMAPHHQHAIDMANVMLANGTDPELRTMAQQMIAMQAKEIEELASIKAELTGSAILPAMMHPHPMGNSGVPMPDELLGGANVNLAFLDGMLPHHSGAIAMASVALRHTQHPRVAALARRMVDDQAREIGDMIAIRRARYEGANHGFPHAAKVSAPALSSK